MDSFFALIKIYQYNLAGSFYKTDLISHISVQMRSNETRLIMLSIATNFHSTFVSSTVRFVEFNIFYYFKVVYKLPSNFLKF